MREVVWWDRNCVCKSVELCNHVPAVAIAVRWLCLVKYDINVAAKKRCASQAFYDDGAQVFFSFFPSR